MQANLHKLDASGAALIDSVYPSYVDALLRRYKRLSPRTGLLTSVSRKGMVLRLLLQSTAELPPMHGPVHSKVSPLCETL